MMTEDQIEALGDCARRVPCSDDHERAVDAALVEIKGYRAAMVRLVTAQQWAVAIALYDPGQYDPDDWSAGWAAAMCEVGCLIPCADDVVAEALGER